ncbi:hypothetical protein [Methylobacterium sp. JK268]
MISALSSATSGLLAATGRADQAATRIAEGGAADGGTLDAAVTLATARTDVSVEAAVLRQANEIQKRVLDILA